MQHWNFRFPVRSTSSRYMSSGILRSDNHLKAVTRNSHGWLPGRHSFDQTKDLPSLFVKPVAQMVEVYFACVFKSALCSLSTTLALGRASTVGVTVGAPRIFHAALAA